MSYKNTTPALACFLVLCASKGVGQVRPWFEESTVRDLTGDELPDTLVVTAEGKVSDSLRARFQIRSRGRVVWVREWSSAASLLHEEWQTMQQRDSIIRFWLRGVLAGKVFPVRAKTQSVKNVPLDRDWVPAGRFNTNDPRDLIAHALRFEQLRPALTPSSPDSVYWQLWDEAWTSPDTVSVSLIWRTMLAENIPVYEYAIGVEGITQIAWSSRQGRFFEIDACC